jgi:hypothetical protein
MKKLLPETKRFPPDGLSLRRPGMEGAFSSSDEKPYAP